ncbi:type II toxin-antitoxin system RelE/ParE family toxin [Roseococcus sp. SYP-B2431]|uniref:type II toxin-antitoxin system RelE/ParE family toxin n=1 Tax=Roseococcus sp. SYP-B2431 TaxID=2496640 RepID=UPI00103F09E7|nr:type II toxin-antitoxin system RelE/ParE family toxin [Roseococcus sp. SYP-B2431]TCI00184.1 type II toxin-antitoxin system RelE/ParE family toxin [Roseococcus sp. SYP-B2431]
MLVVWTRAALSHLEELQDYIAQESPQAAYKLAVELTERTNLSLAEHPMMGRRGRARGTRELILADTSYIVVYQAMKDRVEILAVIHAAREWPESFD